MAPWMVQVTCRLDQRKRDKSPGQMGAYLAHLEFLEHLPPLAGRGSGWTCDGGYQALILRGYQCQGSGR